MSLFQQYILTPVRNGLSKPDAGIPIPLTKLAKFTNYIERGQNIVISGRETSGKKSFMDFIYFINVFRWWRDLDMPEDQKPPIKFYYFNLRGKEQVLIQKWFSLIMKLEFESLMDIPTLNSGVGRLYDLTDEDAQKIQAGEEFLSDLEKHLTVISKAQTPSDIYNYVRKDLEKCGSFNDDGMFVYDERYRGQMTFVYINDTDSLSPESDGFAMMSGDSLQKRLGSYLSELKEIYKTTNIWVSPSKSSFSRNVRDTQPSYKDLGFYTKFADLGLVLYNPFNENNNKYQGYPVDELVIKNKNRFRTVTIVQNAIGVENITSGLIFLGECGYFRESPRPTEEDSWEEIKALLRQLP